MPLNLQCGAIMKKILVAILMAISLGFSVAQNYTSANNGSYTSAANWTNTSGWGTATPPIDGTHGSGTITMQNNMSVGSAYSLGSVTLNIAATKTLTVNGDFTAGGGSTVNVDGTLNISGNTSVSKNFNIPAGGVVNAYGNLTLNGGSTMNVYGTLNVTGNVTLNGNFNVQPGGVVIVDGSVTVNSSQYLVIGTNVAAPPFASMVIKQNLISNSSGDVRIRQNGRLAVFGNFTGSNSGGTVILLDDDADLYINGTTTFTGGNDHVTNNNTASSWGFYTDHTPTYSGGGSNTNGSAGANAVKPVSNMQTDNPDFYNWVHSLAGNPLPVTLLFFKIKDASEQQVKLIWATATEMNFHYFNILRSTDGVNFEIAGAVNGSGNSVERIDYSFTDNFSWKGTVYYALEAVDFDGSSETFKMTKADLTDVHQVTFYPDASNGQLLHVSFNFNAQSETAVYAYDMSGRVVYEGALKPGSNDYVLEQEFPSGVLVMKIYSNEISSTQRVIVK